MKRKYILGFLAPILLLGFGCGKSFLERNPQGQLTDQQLNNTKAVEWLLVGAYGLMNGNSTGTWGNYASAPSQWLFGDVAADNGHKGSELPDQATMLDIEKHSAISVNEHLSTMWNNYYEGVIRCNATLTHLKALQASGSADKFSAERATVIEAEARMLRGHYYFFLWRVFKNIPYIDENITTSEAAKTPNNVDVLPKIVEDFQFAVEKLPDAKPLGEIGRVDKVAAKAYLGKVLLYQKKYPDALVLFKQVIAARPTLVDMPFLNNFDVKTENGPESILSVQHTINPNGSGDNGNVGDMLQGIANAPSGCCGFLNPTFDLVNAFKVTTSGLPMLDNSYRTNPYKSDFGLTSAQKASYVLDRSIRFDPRVDYTVGRRGVPYHDWGLMPGDNWIREAATGGSFIGYKHTINLADFTGNTATGAANITSLNVNIIRLADVYLMAAECAAEAGDLAYALARVNDVRNRAAKLPGKTADGSPTAVYLVSPYPSFASKDNALSAIRFERRLELAFEGHRFYDLLRWGIAKSVLDSYSAFEGSILNAYGGLNFEEKDAYFPIPQEQIDRSSGALKQNDGY